VRIEQIEAGEEVVREGTRAEAFYVLLAGEAEVERGGRRLGSVRPGDCFGELALLTYTPRTATVRTTVLSNVLVLDEPEFRDLVTESREFGRSVFAAAATRVL
jgi:CRP-like cAMP-binding protein